MPERWSSFVLLQAGAAACMTFYEWLPLFMSSYTMTVPHAAVSSAGVQAAVLCEPCDAESKLIIYMCRYLGGNFAPVKKEVHSEALEVVGALPEGLEGVFARTGPNPEQLAGDYHWRAHVYVPLHALARLWPHQARC